MACHKPIPLSCPVPRLDGAGEQRHVEFECSIDPLKQAGVILGEVKRLDHASSKIFHGFSRISSLYVLVPTIQPVEGMCECGHVGVNVYVSLNVMCVWV